MISSGPIQLPQLAPSTTFLASEPSGLIVKRSHLSLLLASFSLTQPFLLRQKRMREPSGEKRGNQSTFSPLVMALTCVPSVLIVNRSWLPMRELDQTIVPLTLPPMAFMASASSSEGFSSEPVGGAPVSVAHEAASVPSRMNERRRRCVLMTGSLLPGWGNSGESLRGRRAAGSRDRAWHRPDRD